MKVLLCALFISVQILFLSSPTDCRALDVLPGTVKWQEWSQDIFVRAGQTHKFVLLDLEAVWCHWCHVMDATTYADPTVQKLLSENFVTVKVDQDSRPDLSNRYRSFGWPATIIFDSQGNEIAKRAGYLEPEEFTKLLTAVVENPKTVPLVVRAKPRERAHSFDEAQLISELERRVYASFDDKHGGLRLARRFLEPDTIEYLLGKAAAGKEKEQKMVRQYLDSAKRLIDPVWGGAYQYSTHHNWNKPHYEKIMSTQSNYLRSYSLAAGVLDSSAYMEAAKSIASYLKVFLRDPAGPFYVSQDADLIPGKKDPEFFTLSDHERRARGMPRIDTHKYSLENGMAISGLTSLYAVNGEDSLIALAENAARWVIENRTGTDGGFTHGAEDKKALYLGDTLWMTKALHDLYATTGNRKYLEEAIKQSLFLIKHFQQSGEAGFFTARTDMQWALPPVRRFDENLLSTRLLNSLFHYSGNKELKKGADQSFSFIKNSEAALATISEPGVLIAINELETAPLHVTIVGKKDDLSANQLFLSAIRYPVAYKRTEWWDRREGALPNADVTYPELGAAAAFICTDQRCSLPIFKPELLAKRIKAIQSK